MDASSVAVSQPRHLGTLMPSSGVHTIGHALPAVLRVDTDAMIDVRHRGQTVSLILIIFVPPCEERAKDPGCRETQ